MEWNGGVDYWSGVLDWSTGVPRPQMSISRGQLSSSRCHLVLPASSYAISEDTRLAKLRRLLL